MKESLNHLVTKQGAGRTKHDSSHFWQLKLVWKSLRCPAGPNFRQLKLLFVNEGSTCSKHAPTVQKSCFGQPSVGKLKKIVLVEQL